MGLTLSIIDQASAACKCFFLLFDLCQIFAVVTHFTIFTWVRKMYMKRMFKSIDYVRIFVIGRILSSFLA